MANLLSRSPFGLLNEIQRDMNRLFDARLLPVNGELMTGSERWVPAVDIHEDDKAYHVSVDVPGIPSKDIEVTAHDGVLRISGKRELVNEDKDAHRIERSFGSFLREFRMPENADLDHVEARNKDGVLDIVVPKVAKPEPKRIEVR